jgi:NADP-dependent 3-hydroxy acid dehydrogenase YdfG
MDTVFITGASSGFGSACAIRFAGSGRKLILAARRAKRLEKLADLLKKDSPVHVMAVDVRDRHAVKEQIKNLPQEFAQIDVLINNAGLALGLSPFQETDPDDWEMMLDTNIRGLLHVTRMVLPGMVERKRGHIVNLGSVAGDWPYAGGNVYGATKAFVKQFSRNLRADLQGTPIRVTNIEPGMAETEFSLVRFKGDSKKAAGVYKRCKPLSSEDIAEIVYWVTMLPPHVNVNRVEVMPTCQSWSPLAVYRE